MRPAWYLLLASSALAATWNCITTTPSGNAAPTALNPTSAAAACANAQAVGGTFSQSATYSLTIYNLQTKQNIGSFNVTVSGQGVCTCLICPPANQAPNFNTGSVTQINSTQAQWATTVNNYTPVFAGGVVVGSSKQGATGVGNTIFSAPQCTCGLLDCCNPAAAGQCSSVCQPHQCVPCDPTARQKVTVNPDLVCTPIVLDPFHQGFHFTSPEDGVLFDVFGTGAFRISWPAAWAENAWLVLPDASGQVKTFAQFFGNLTPQPAAAHPNGYLALAVWDGLDRGGNANGMIDPGDRIWPRLRLWIDANHDGLAQLPELHTLDEMAVGWISLDHHWDPHSDPWGDLFGWAGTADVNSCPARIWDVAVTSAN